MNNEHFIIDEMAEESGSYDYQSFKYALEDGAFLETTGWRKRDIEKAHNICVKKLAQKDIRDASNKENNK